MALVRQQQTFRNGVPSRAHVASGCKPWLSEIDAREILLAYAERYPGYPIERELPYGWGKVANHSLDEAVWLIPVTRAYDLVRETLNARERTLIETKLLALAADHIQGQKFHRIHNIECWHNAALAAVGICLDDAGLQKVALDERFGFRHQLREGVLDDGMWWEGSSSYHFYTLAALIAHAQVSESIGTDLHDDDRLKAMFRAPVSLAFPDFRLACHERLLVFLILAVGRLPRRAGGGVLLRGGVRVVRGRGFRPDSPTQLFRPSPNGRGSASLWRGSARSGRWARP